MKKTWFFLNKHLHLILIISTIISYTNNKFYKNIVWFIKLFIFANIIFGVGLIVYFSASEHSFYIGFNIYKDLIYNYLSYYMNQLIDLWNSLTDLEDSYIKQAINNSSNKIPINQIKEELSLSIKDGVKEGINDAINDILDKIHENDNNKIETYKNIAFISTALMLGYFIFILPGSSISLEDLNQYNWINKSLIEIKINIINYFSNPSNPGTPGNNGINLPTPIIDTIISPTSTIISENLSTITPNTPIASTSNLSPTVLIDKSTQTIIDGKTVSKMVETVNILSDSIGEENSELIKQSYLELN